jgi:hypothetical protein
VAVNGAPGGKTAPSWYSANFQVDPMCLGFPCPSALTISWTGTAIFTHTAKDEYGDHYALTSATINWHVTKTVDAFGCTTDAAGVLNHNATTPIFTGSGRVLPVVAGHPEGDWNADFAISGALTPPGAPGRAMIWGNQGISCTNPIPPGDGSALFFGPGTTSQLVTRSTFGPATIGLPISSDLGSFAGAWTDNSHVPVPTWHWSLTGHA